MLILSASVGGGHDRAAEVVALAARDLWPECSIERVDMLGRMGARLSRLGSKGYLASLDRIPWLYGFFYEALRRSPRFAQVAKTLVAAVAGRALRRYLGEGSRRGDAEADVVVSTHPFGGAAADWLRRRGALGAGTGMVLTDVAPHPFWVWGAVDVHAVMLEACRAEVRRLGAREVRVCAAPVAASFYPRNRRDARHLLGLHEEGIYVLVTGGELGMGAMTSAVEALVAGPDGVRIVVVCGRNEALRQRLLLHYGQSSARVRVLGWVQDMSTWMAACDAVVTGAGGVTALEAMAAEREVLFYDPIAGHGRANAQLLVAAGYGQLCSDSAALRAAAAALGDPAGGRPSRGERESLGGVLAELATRRRQPRRGAPRRTGG